MYDFIDKHKRFVCGLLGIVVVASIIGLRFVKYNNNIELMLPSDASVQNTMRFLRDNNSLDRLVISLGLKDQLHTTQDLIHSAAFNTPPSVSILSRPRSLDRNVEGLIFAADQLAASIKSPLVSEVISNVSTGNISLEMVSFLKYLPQISEPGIFFKINRLITPAAVKGRLKFIYRQSLSPGSSFFMPFFRADPLGLSSEVLQTIEKLSTSSGYEVVITNGHFISRDSRHAMVILKTPVALTEGFGARKLITYLKEKLKYLPAFISADIIAGHMHTVSNEDVIKRDIHLTTSIASLAFLFLFLFFFRDPKAVMIFLIPLVAVLIAINITHSVFKNLSYSVIGMGTVIAGISIDYGIYIYIAVKKAGRSLETIRQVIKPIVFGVLTTISVFIVFFLSSVKGYQQLAFFSNASIILCLILAIFILPHFLNKENKPSQAPVIKSFKPFNFKVRDSVLVLGWLLILTAMLIPARELRFNNSISQFDGSAKEVLSAEERFHNVWAGKALPAIFVVPATTLEDAYEKNTAVYEAAIKEIGQDNFVSLASVWPGPNRRRANAMLWQEFWTDKKEKELRKLLAVYGKAYNFSPDAFADFFKQLHTQMDIETEPKGLSFFAHLKEQFVLKKDNGYKIMSFFPDQDENIARLSAVSKNFPGSFLVSRKHFSNLVSQALSSELIWLSLLAVSLTAALTFLLLKDIQLALLALAPVITSIIMIAAIFPLAGLSFNMSSIIASMVVVGIVSDYGMFVVYYCKNKFNTGTYLAVTFAAVTTLIGAGVLLFARHPILFSIGVTVVTGVLSGYLCSLIVIAPLYRVWIKEPVK